MAPPPPLSPAEQRGAVLRYLLDHARADGTIPGRGPTCEATGVSQRQYGQILAKLVEAGAVVGRAGHDASGIGTAGVVVRHVAERLLTGQAPPQRETAGRRRLGWRMAQGA